MAQYTLTNETIVHDGGTLHRVRYSDGTLGGWIENESNLSQEGEARVLDKAKVYGNARVSDNAWVCGWAEVYGEAKVSGNAFVYGFARVSDNAQVADWAEVYGNARVFGMLR